MNTSLGTKLTESSQWNESNLGFSIKREKISHLKNLSMVAGYEIDVCHKMKPLFLRYNNDLSFLRIADRFGSITGSGYLFTNHEWTN